MPGKRTVLSRYRPRLLTLLVLCMTTAVLALANLSPEIRAVEDGDPQFSAHIKKVSFGWPLTWRRYVLFLSPGGGGVSGWYCNSGRLAIDLFYWVLSLTAAAAGSEWLLRRFRPRFRWSLRTMLATIALVALGCGWYVTARHRANLEEPIVSMIKRHHGRVSFRRWGPQWLDLVGTDIFRRRVSGVELLDIYMGGIEKDQQEYDEILKRLQDLPELQELLFEVDELPSGTSEALRKMPRLRVLDVGQQGVDGEDVAHRPAGGEYLAAIEQMTRLQHLRVQGIPMASGDLASLARLTNLESLALQSVSGEREVASGKQPDESDDPLLLMHFPVLPRLKVVDLLNSQVGDRDLRSLSVLPRLESLGLEGTSVTDRGLTELGTFESLEELAVDQQTASAKGLEALLAVKRLKRLHIAPSYQESESALTLDGLGQIVVPAGESGGLRHALEALRRAKPGIVIDGDAYAISLRLEQQRGLRDYDTAADRGFGWLFGNDPPLRPPSFWARSKLVVRSKSIENLAW